MYLLGELIHSYTFSFYLYADDSCSEYIVEYVLAARNKVQPHGLYLQRIYRIRWQ
jgi:hypothetical protein